MGEVTKISWTDHTLIPGPGARRSDRVRSLLRRGMVEARRRGGVGRSSATAHDAGDVAKAAALE